jgi:hypothetical protein
MSVGKFQKSLFFLWKFGVKENVEPPEPPAPPEPPYVTDCLPSFKYSILLKTLYFTIAACKVKTYG